MLADWMTSPRNPFFARRWPTALWAHFFGIGLVDPVDEFWRRQSGQPSRMLDDLAQAFIAPTSTPSFSSEPSPRRRAYQPTSDITTRARKTRACSAACRSRV